MKNKYLIILKNELDKFYVKYVKLDELLKYVPNNPMSYQHMTDEERIQDKAQFDGLINDISKGLIKDLILELIEEMSKYTSKEEIIKSLNYDLKKCCYEELNIK